MFGKYVSMYIRVTLYFLLFCFGCQSNERTSGSIAPSPTKDSISHSEHNLSLSHAALASLDSSELAALKNDWKKMELKGKVKSITEDHCLLRKGSDQPDKPCKDHIVYQFNEFGFLVSKLTSVSDLSGQIEKYIYDSTGQHAIQVEMPCSKKEFCRSTVCKYDERGNRVEELSKQDGKDHWKYIYQFDEKDRMIGFEGFALAEGGHRAVTVTQTYDDRGNALKQILIHKEDTSITAHRYEYDKLNRVIEKVTRYHSKTFKYNKTTEYKYNSSGQVVEEFEKESPPLKITITYDKHGNWVKKLSKYQNSPSTAVDERIIEYF
jgi:YD repeat-containing protein